MRPLDIVPKGEEGIGTQSHILHPIQPGPLFLPGKHRGLLLKDFLPRPICQHIHMLFADVHVDGIVPVCPLDPVHEG